MIFSQTLASSLLSPLNSPQFLSEKTPFPPLRRLGISKLHVSNEVECGNASYCFGGVRDDVEVLALAYYHQIHRFQMMNLCKGSKGFINRLWIIRSKHGSFSSLSSSSRSSSLPLISPLCIPKPTQTQLSEPPNHTLKSRRKSKYISHESAIHLISNERDPQRALETFNMVAEQRGFNHNHATYSAILHKLAKAKKFEAVDALLHQMTYETCKFHESIFINLMKHFAKSSLYERVLEMFYAIQPIVRQKPSLNAISTCLNLLVESKKEVLACKFLLYCKKSLSLEPNVCIFNILIKYHCKCGDLDSAFEVMKEMRQSLVSYPNLITYSTLMDGLCRSGKLKEAMALFEEMVSKDQIVPDALTYNVLINGFSCWGKVNEARKIMEFMKSNGCNPNLVNYSAMMNGFCKEGMLNEAKELFNEMKSFGLGLDTVGYTTLIDSFCKAGKIDEAMEVLEEMKETKCRADIVTVNVVLKGLCRVGRSDEATRMLEKVDHEGIHLNKSSYRIVLNCLLENGKLLKATKMLGLMLDKGFVPHHATSNELLIRLCAEGMADDAITALFGLVEMGFKPELECWEVLIEVICRERKLLYVFELLDDLVMR